MPDIPQHTLATDTMGMSFDPRIGQIASFVVNDNAQQIAPLHRAPWVGTDTDLPADAPPHLTLLGGDFFCAPFGGREAGSPQHGWPANAPWTLDTAAQTHLTATLSHPVCGATLTKNLRLHPGHPFVYQRHTFAGGAGRIPVANHANVAVPNGALIRTSPKRLWITPEDPQESDPTRGRSILRYPASSTDPTRFPGAEGPIDLTRYPFGPRHEDFVAALDPPAATLGWTAITRPVEGDLFLSLKHAAFLPMTMLWHSNGGRDYAPWSGRHKGCLGVEEGAAGTVLGHGPAADAALTLQPGGETSVTHAIGAIAWPSGSAVTDIALDHDTLTITGTCGTTRQLPFDAGWLDL
ncbi:MAG: hypothetical protein AAFQ39_15670 [Pseudomonadota bacterium]